MQKKFLIAGLIVVLAWLVNMIAPYYYFSKLNTCNVWETTGQFGDQFGAVNALFSGLALLFIVITLCYQSHQLKLQQQDLKIQHELLTQTISENEAQTMEYRKQVEEMSRQRLETNFYSMVFEMSNTIAGKKIQEYRFEDEEAAEIPEKERFVLFLEVFFKQQNKWLYDLFRQVEYLLDFMTNNLFEGEKVKHDFDMGRMNNYFEYVLVRIPEEYQPYLVSYYLMKNKENKKIHRIIVDFKLDKIVTISDEYSNGIYQEAVRVLDM